VLAVSSRLITHRGLLATKGSPTSEPAFSRKQTPSHAANRTFSLLPKHKTTSGFAFSNFAARKPSHEATIGLGAENFLVETLLIQKSP
jgi:hypothetical protein